MRAFDLLRSASSSDVELRLTRELSLLVFWLVIAESLEPGVMLLRLRILALSNLELEVPLPGA